MDNNQEIEKARLLENDFPAKIPEDIGRKPLEVVRETGETVGIFYDTSFLRLKTSDRMEYAKGFDEIFISASDNYSTLKPKEKEEWCKQNPAFDSNAWSGMDDVCKARIALCRMAYPYDYPYNFSSRDGCQHGYINYLEEIANEDDDDDWDIFNMSVKIFTDYGRVLLKSFQSVIDYINDQDLPLWEQVIINLEAMDERTLWWLIHGSWENEFGFCCVKGEILEKLSNPINRVLRNPNISFLHRKRLESLLYPSKVSEPKNIDSFFYTYKTLHKYQWLESNLNEWYGDSFDGDPSNCPLEVVNEVGEIIALIYDPSLCVSDQGFPEYIKLHDQIFECWEILDVDERETQMYWGDFDADTDEQEKVDSEILAKLDQKYPNLRLDLFRDLCEIGWTMVVLCRLAYPYLLNDYEGVRKKFESLFERYYLLDEDLLHQQILLFNDPKVIQTYMDLRGIGKLLDYMEINNFSEMLYENPELFFNRENISSPIDLANTSRNTKLLAFLLDYKNMHFPADGLATAGELTNGN